MQVNLPLVRLEWFPGYNQLKDALAAYGYLSDSSINISSLSDVDHSSKLLNLITSLLKVGPCV